MTDTYITNKLIKLGLIIGVLAALLYGCLIFSVFEYVCKKPNLLLVLSSHGLALITVGVFLSNVVLAKTTKSWVSFGLVSFSVAVMFLISFVLLFVRCSGV